MVLTRKQAAAPVSSSSDVSSPDPTSQSNLSLLASSAFCQTVRSSSDSLMATPATRAAAVSTKAGLAGSFGYQEKSDCSHAQPCPMSVNRKLPESITLDISGLPTSQPVVTSPGPLVAEGSIPSSASFSLSHLMTDNGNVAVHGNNNNGNQQATAPRYKIVYRAMQATPAATCQQSSVPTTVSVGLTSFFPTTMTNSISRPASSTSYRIIVAPDKDSSTSKNIYVPVSKASSTQLLPGTSLLRPPKPNSTATSAALTSLAGNNAALKPKPPVTTSSTFPTTSPTFFLPSTMPFKTAVNNSVSQALFKLASSAKATMASDVSAASFSVTQPAATVSIPNFSTERGETTVYWDAESTLKLIDLYKEHQAYLNDHHYKKKSVWELIAAKMRQSRADCPPFCWNHVENKWKNMTKKYRDCIDMNRQNGTQVKCPFYDEIAAIYSYNPDEDQKTAAEGLRALKSGSQKKNSSTMNGSSGTFIRSTNSSSSAVPATKFEQPLLSENMLGDSSGDASEMEPLLVKKKKYARLSEPNTTFVNIAKQNLSQSVNVNPKENETKDSNSMDIASLLKQLREDRARQDKVRMDRLEAMHQEKMQMFSQFLDILKQSKQS